MTRHLTSKYLDVTVTYISWSTKFALYLGRCMNVILIDNDCNVAFALKQCRSQ